MTKPADSHRVPGLPRERTSFIGRADEKAVLDRCLDDGEQLVTIVGPPGIGKTRLAIHHAACCHRRDGRAVIFCDLTSARTRADVHAALARALEEQLTDNATVDLGRALARRGEALVLLDNFEQVVSVASAEVAEWMDLAPETVFVVTSRERLRIEGEHCVQLGSLEMPAEDIDNLNDALRVESVQLLVQRARAVRSVPLADDDAAALSAIARRLEGMPLAIELLAPRLAMVGPTKLTQLLDGGLDNLSSGLRGAPPRRATLRGAIDASWELLHERTRDVLAQASVFRGGFDVEAAVGVIDATTGPQATPGLPRGELEVLDALQELGDRSLLAVEDLDSGERRYRLYEPIREHAAAHLVDAPGAEQRHARWYARAGAAWALAARTREAPQALRRIALESENLIAGYERALNRGATEEALELALALEPLFLARGPIAHHVDRLDRALEADARQPRAAAGVLAASLASRGHAHAVRAHLDDAIRDFEQAAKMAVDAENPGVAALALIRLANAHIIRRALSEAEQALARAEPYVTASDSPWHDALFARIRGAFERQRGRTLEAMVCLEQAARTFRAAGDLRELAQVLLGQGIDCLERVGDIGAAVSLLNEAAALARRHGDHATDGRALLFLGVARRERGEIDEANACFTASLEIQRRVGNRYFERWALLNLAGVALEQRCPEEALAHLAEARAFAETHDPVLSAWIAADAAVALVQQGDLEHARAGFTEARNIAAASEHADLHAALPLLEAHLAVALASRARTSGRAEEASTLQRSARQTLAAFDADERVPRAVELRWARRLLARVLDDTPSAPRAGRIAERRPDVLVGPEGRWFERTGRRGRVDLSRRSSLRRILDALTTVRVERGAHGLGLDDLLQAGWPGERMSTESAAARVYNAIQRLRRLGLDGVLVTRDDGYLLDPAVLVARAGG